jgi:CheY-like chemotaxis protein
MDTESNTRYNIPDNISPPVPLILLASDNPRAAVHLQDALQTEGISVKFAPGYSELEALSQANQDGAVLLEVSHPQSVEAAVELALRLKRRDAGQFVGYLADPVMHTSGLAGDAIFPRSAHHLPRALRAYFNREA